mgnify:FL=1
MEIKLLSTTPQSITINIYNILGQNIVKWNVDIDGPGETELLWDRKNNIGKLVSDGVYYIEMIGQNKRIVEKITLLKSSD